MLGNDRWDVGDILDLENSAQPGAVRATGGGPANQQIQTPVRCGFQAGGIIQARGEIGNGGGWCGRRGIEIADPTRTKLCREKLADVLRRKLVVIRIVE